MPNTPELIENTLKVMMETAGVDKSYTSFFRHSLRQIAISAAEECRSNVNEKFNIMKSKILNSDLTKQNG